jgi:hypothetical protein
MTNAQVINNAPLIEASGFNSATHIDKYLKVRGEKAISDGEVFTPISLINEMLDYLNDLPKNIWCDPTQKFLDSSCGTGNFMIIIYERLMAGLTSKIGDKKTRSTHIITKMLFMVEYDQRNYDAVRELFGTHANIYKGSFIDNVNTGWKKQFGINKQYDFVGFNPPYNTGGIKSCKSTVGTTIWGEFVIMAMNVLKKGGHQLMVHPSTWTGMKNTKISKFITSKKIIKLRAYTASQSKKIFGGKSGNISTAIYLLENSPSDINHSTKLYDTINETYIDFNIHVYKSIPTAGASIQKKMMDKIKNNILANTISSAIHRIIDGSPIKTDTHKHTLIRVVDAGIKKVYIAKEPTHINKPKLIVGNCSYGYPLIDKKGNKCPARGHVIINYELAQMEKIQTLFYTPLISYLLTNTKVSMGFYNRGTFKLISDTSDMGFDPANSELLYEHYGFTPAEINEINNHENKGIGMVKQSLYNNIKNCDN